VALGSRPAAVKAQSGGSFQPARHPQDAWFDAVPGKHRNFIDASTVSGAGEAVLYANNLYDANASGYSLTDADVAVVVCFRHFATVFGYTDAIWAKYGKVISGMIGFTDPKTQAAPATNLLMSPDYGMQLSNFGRTIPTVTKRGTQFAICDMATHFFSMQLATQTGGTAEAIYKELVASLIPSSHLVPAGVVAANRAQEHGYTMLTAL
jgi:intracellular sulfur oxidation DsrE/DsrF family protein